MTTIKLKTAIWGMTGLIVALCSLTIADAHQQVAATQQLQTNSVEYSPAKATTFFADGRKSSHTTTQGTTTVYIDLDNLVGGFLASYEHLHSGRGLSLVQKADGKVVAVENGKELDLRQIEFEYRGGRDAYWEVLEQNDPTNSISVHRH